MNFDKEKLFIKDYSSKEGSLSSRIKVVLSYDNLYNVIIKQIHYNVGENGPDLTDDFDISFVCKHCGPDVNIICSEASYEPDFIKENLRFTTQKYSPGLTFEKVDEFCDNLKICKALAGYVAENLETLLKGKIN